MYVVHPSQTLNAVFRNKPYQGCCPKAAAFLFIGLDANYAEDIEKQIIFPDLIEYHRDPVRYWQQHDIHHPFLLAHYRGDGKKFHKEFAKIGLAAKYADQISFIELLHVPTVGRNKLTVNDLNEEHLTYIRDAIFSKSKKAVFMSDTVFRLLKKSALFSWLNHAQSLDNHTLQVFFSGDVMVYKHLHFSTYGKFQPQKQAEAAAIRALITAASASVDNPKHDPSTDHALGLHIG